eukprot:3229454-Pyramimonas_sp.AAC.1
MPSTCPDVMRDFGELLILLAARGPHLLRVAEPFIFLHALALLLHLEQGLRPLEPVDTDVRL